MDVAAVWAARAEAGGRFSSLARWGQSFSFLLTGFVRVEFNTVTHSSLQMSSLCAIGRLFFFFFGVPPITFLVFDDTSFSLFEVFSLGSSVERLPEISHPDLLSRVVILV